MDVFQNKPSSRLSWGVKHDPELALLQTRIRMWVRLLLSAYCIKLCTLLLLQARKEAARLYIVLKCETVIDGNIYVVTAYHLYLFVIQGNLY